MTSESPYRSSAPAEPPTATPALGRLLGTHPAPPFWKRAWPTFALACISVLLPLATSLRSDNPLWGGLLAIPALVLGLVAIDQRATLGVRIFLYDEGLVVE